MNYQNILTNINLITIWGMLALIFIYWFRVLYILYGFTKEEPIKPTDKRFRYAILIPARNESRVINSILRSIKAQDYPKELIDVYVIVEDEADPTVNIVKDYGYYTVVRPTLEGRRTKGYALDDAITYIKQAQRSYDAYFIFDADNILEKDFISKMNSLKADGVQLGMGYRHSKNASENIIAGCSEGLMIMLNTLFGKGRSRFIHKIVLSGTGYFLDSDLVDKAGGFIWNGLTEDCELNYWCYENNIRCAYTTDAVFYDEQATTVKQTLKQHTRWLWGCIHANKIYHKRVRKAFFKKKGEKLAKLDFLIGLTPLILMLLLMVGNLIFSSVLGFAAALEGNRAFILCFKNAFRLFAILYLFFSCLLLTALVAEHKHHTFGFFEMIKVCLFFPIYGFFFIIAFFKGLNKKNLTWQPIEHKGQTSVLEFKENSEESPDYEIR